MGLIDVVFFFKALSKANQAQNKAKEASQKVQEAKKELDDIAAILSTVQEPGKQNFEAVGRGLKVRHSSTGNSVARWLYYFSVFGRLYH